MILNKFLKVLVIVNYPATRNGQNVVVKNETLIPQQMVHTLQNLHIKRGREEDSVVGSQYPGIADKPFELILNSHFDVGLTSCKPVTILARKARKYQGRKLEKKLDQIALLRLWLILLIMC